MRVYRKILAASVDTNNLGCHTAKDWKTMQRYDVAGNSYKYHKAENERTFLVWISVSAENINVEATAESNKQYPAEKEVVLLPNQTVKILIYCAGELIYKGTANTGTRADAWVNEY